MHRCVFVQRVGRRRCVQTSRISGAGLENAVAGLKRFRVLEERDINRETFVESWPEAGLMVADSPYDPAPSIRIVDGRIVELDGRAEEDFDTLDVYIARHGIDLAVAPEAMALDSLTIAHMLADINVPRALVLRLATGCTPAKLVDIMRWPKCVSGASPPIRHMSPIAAKTRHC